MLLPALGATYIPLRVKASICLVVTLVIAPVVFEDVKNSISSGHTIVLTFAREVAIGLIVGLSMRLLAYAAGFAGGIIASLLGMTNVFGINLDNGESTSILETLLALTTTALIFSTDTHHLMIASIKGSYDAYPPAQVLDGQQMLIVAVDSIRRATIVAIHIAAPILLFSTISNCALALINRFVQQVPFYFVMTGFIILLGLALLAATIDRSIMKVVESLVESIAR